MENMKCGKVKSEENQWEKLRDTVMEFTNVA